MAGYYKIKVRRDMVLKSLRFFAKQRLSCGRKWRIVCSNKLSNYDYKIFLIARKNKVFIECTEKKPLVNVMSQYKWDFHW